MTLLNPLTREQKLLAEIIVQLGNVTEAIKTASTDPNLANYQTQISSLQSEVTTLTSNNAELSQQLADANAVVAQLQQTIQSNAGVDVTPDSIDEVISSLGIDHA